MSHLKISGLKVRAIVGGIPTSFVDHLSFPENESNKGMSSFVRHTGIRYQYKMPNNASIEAGFQELGEKVLAKLNWSAAEIDCCVVVTQTLQQPLPALSNRLQYALNMPQSCMAFDVNSGCSGFPYGMAMISSLLKASLKQKSKALLFIGDYSNQLIAPNDSSTAFLFSDVLSVIAVDFDADIEEQIYFNLETDGSGAGAIFSEKIAGIDYMRLNGLDVYQYSLNLVPKHILDTLSLSAMRPIHVVLHQANQLINKSIAKELQGANLNFYDSLAQYGNSGSASIPLTLLHHQELLKGQTVLCCGFGVGFSVSSLIFHFSRSTYTQLISLRHV